jgi:hypothetical protein
MSDFDKLLAELSQEAENQETLAKSLAAPAADDAKIAAAAADGADKTNPEDEEDLTKSLDGVNAAAAAAGVAVIDGEEFAKSIDSLGGRMSAAEDVLAKAMDSALGMIRIQGDMIKSLNDKVTALSGEGRGRKTVVTVTDRHTAGEPLVKSTPAYTVGEVLAKANTAFDAKKITGLELTTLDVALRNGTPPSESVLARIVS